MSVGIRQAIDTGKVFRRKIYTINDSVFDAVTEESAYWVGFFMADSNMHSGKTGNQRIAIALKKEDYDHLVKLAKFLTCTNKDSRTSLISIVLYVFLNEFTIWFRYIESDLLSYMEAKHRIMKHICLQKGYW